MGQSLLKGSRGPRAEDTTPPPHSVATPVSPPSPPTSTHRLTPSSPGEDESRESKGEERNESPTLPGQPLNSAPSPLTEVIFSEEEILKFTAPHPPCIQPSHSSLFQCLEGKITVVLTPHKHTLFCERKERVCSAVGKVQEQEILKVKGIPTSTNLEGCYWIRSLPNDSHSSYEFIEGTQNSDRYILTARDENCFISFQQSTIAPSAEEGNVVVSHRASNSIGPVLPGPPRLLDLQIVGQCMKGRRVYAEAEYIGGTQGLSEYWWFRIKGGKRVQIGEPQVVSDSLTLEDIRKSLVSGETESSLDDSRVLLLTEEDVGCVLKVKCRPVRVDGYKGEVFTSKASVPVVSEGQYNEGDVSARPSEREEFFVASSPSPPPLPPQEMAEGSAASTTDPDLVIAQYQTTRVRSILANYQRYCTPHPAPCPSPRLTHHHLNRIFQLTKSAAITRDPSTFEVTNTFPYSALLKLGPDEKPDTFHFEVDKQGKFTFKTAHRDQLLCQFFECCTKCTGKFKNFGPYRSQRLRKNQHRVECKLAVASFGIVELAETGKILQEYRWVNFKKIGSDEREQAIFFDYSGRIKIFFVPDMSMFLSSCNSQLAQIGISVKVVTGQNLQEVAKIRLSSYASTGLAVSVFHVNKQTARSTRLVPRQLHITELFIVEKDISGFQYVSSHTLSSVYAVVRCWNDPRKFTIEYLDGSNGVYHCTVRDTLLSLLQDVCHAAGNVKVIITGEVSDNLRLIPRFAEENYESRLLDSIFGAFSIEVWFLRQLKKVVETSPIQLPSVIQLCREFNANVPFPGISPTSDEKLVKTCLTGVMKLLHAHITLTPNLKFVVENPRGVAVVLQTVYRMLPSATGYKSLVQISEVDPKHILLGLLKCEVDFVNYWAIQVLKFLCSCPLESRNIQQEYVNKHTLLTDKLLKSLLDLMGVRITEPIDEIDVALESEDETNDGSPKNLKEVIDPYATDVAPPQQKNPWAQSNAPAQPTAITIETNDLQEEKKVTEFFPNSLVIVGSAELLESIVSSRRDTSSPEMLNIVLDLLAERYEILIHMLRSTSFLIMENAAILLHILIKNRKETASLLQEAALSDCLVLKHFSNGVFSPSASQRFISRFLCSTWMSGTESSPGKKLLRRLLPSGLLEYLKHAPITAEHRAALDEMEDEFYATYGGSSHVPPGRDHSKKTILPGGDLQTRMRNRIGSALKNAVVCRSGEDESVVTPSQPENFRIMFHVMTQDHQLADLVWNEQTRIELRSTLEAEISEYEREQRLKGHKKIAWNYEQFYVKYESLKYMLQVGPIYIHHFLDAQDSFIRTLENPSHGILFEKLVRRMLGNVERDPRLATLCTRCLCRLYDVCHDIIGTFDDTIIVVHLLSEAKDMELNHYIMDFLVILSRVEANLEQLLDRDFIELMLKYASFAHLNPDQIGNALARATGNTLLIEDASEGSLPLYRKSAAAVAASVEASDEEKSQMVKNSMWVPADDACPRIWYTAPRGPIPPPVSSQRGPFRVSQLLDMVKCGEISGETLLAPSFADSDEGDNFHLEVDTGKWNPLSNFFQLRTQMLSPGRAVYSPADIGCKAITLLSNLSSLHRSVNSLGAPFYPTPISKRLMSHPDHLAIFAQLLMCNDRSVVNIAAKLLQSLVNHNIMANSKLYLTGVFFFSMRYTGNDFTTIAELLSKTHLYQSYHDSASSVARTLLIHQKSILGTMLPPALVNVLHRHGPTTFSNVFTGTYDNPEVIWSPEHRTHVIHMVNNHLGDFPHRIRQYTLSQYDYIPIPKVKYSDLDRELYCEEYYLKNLCDEVRFPNWPIRDPLALLREVIERWRVELSKGIADSGEKAALEVLGLKRNVDHLELRKVYKNLARKYHPDKNPNGRAMFEKIQAAYELLTSIEIRANETDMTCVVTILRTQNIIYHRYAEAVKDQKYPAYGLLLQVLRIPSPHSVPEKVDADLLDAGIRLMFYTTIVSPLNALEFVKAGVLPRLHEIICYALAAYKTDHSKALAEVLLTYGMKALSAVALFAPGRAAMAERCPLLAENLYEISSMEKVLPLATENCIESIARGAEDPLLQQALIDAGLVWRLIPHLLSFDDSLEEDVLDETQREKYTQHSCNLLAVLSAKALGRLGGYMFDDYASPKNAEMQQAMPFLLTAPLAKLLRNRRPRELLTSLNENIEKPTKIWNIGMRKEILAFVLKTDQEREPGSHSHDLLPAESFRFSNLKDELCVGAVYVRVFIKNGDVSDIDDPSQFCLDLITYIWNLISSSTTTSSFSIPLSPHLAQCAEALRCLVVGQDYIPHDIVRADHGIDVTLNLLDSPEDSDIFDSAVQVLVVMGGVPEVVSAYASHRPPCLWRIIRTLAVKGSSPVISHLWKCVDGIISHPDGLDAMVEAGAIIRMLGIIFSAPGHQNGFQNRLAAASFLTKFLWNPIKGTESADYLRRFFPEPLILKLKSASGNIALQLLDEVCENPELIWTAEMQGEIRAALTRLFDSTNKVASRDTNSQHFQQDFSLNIPISYDYVVPYRQLKNEIFIGGVYIRLYLKHPTYRLSNPIFFTEKLLEFWESSFDLQVPVQLIQRSALSPDDEESKALVLGKEDFLSLLTSCVVCVIKGEGAIVDHLLSWGFVHKLIELLQRAIERGRVGTPVTCVMRMLHELVSRSFVVDNIASSPIDIMPLFVRSLSSSASGQDELCKDATFIVEIMKNIFQCIGAQMLPELVTLAMKAQVPMFFLDRIIGATSSQLAHLRNPSAIKVYAVDCLKAMTMVSGCPDIGVLQSMLEVHHSWQEFRHQSHDLFITDVERTNHYLIEDSHDKVFASLLMITDGSTNTTSLPKEFTSTGSYGANHLHQTPRPPPAQPISASQSIPDPNTTSTAPSVPSFRSAPSGTSSGPKIVTTSVVKGEYGIGLDLVKSSNGRPCIQKLKEMPAGVVNPASLCNPPIQPGDIIVGVNGKPSGLFSDTIKIIRGLDNGRPINLQLERGA